MPVLARLVVVALATLVACGPNGDVRLGPLSSSVQVPFTAPATTSPADGPPVPTPVATLAGSAPGTAGAGGSVVVTIPSAAPVACTPEALAVVVGATATMTCDEVGYIGALTVLIADPTIASVAPYNAENPDLFAVTGLAAGTTTVSLRGQSGGMGSAAIVVSP